MNKVYSRINWENEPSTKTPLNEHNLNKIDFAVDEIDNRVIELDSTKAKNTDLQTLSTRVDNLILNAGDSSAECTDARVTEDGTTYDTLKKRLDAEHSSVIEDISQLSNENGYLHKSIGLKNLEWKIGSCIYSETTETATTGDAYKSQYRVTTTTPVHINAGDVLTGEWEQNILVRAFYVGDDGSRGQLGDNEDNWFNSDYTFTIDGNYMFLIRFHSENVVLSNHHELSDLLYVVESDSLKNRIDTLGSAINKIDNQKNNFLETVSVSMECDSRLLWEVGSLKKDTTDNTWVPDWYQASSRVRTPLGSYLSLKKGDRIWLDTTNVQCKLFYIPNGGTVSETNWFTTFYDIQTSGIYVLLAVSLSTEISVEDTGNHVHLYIHEPKSDMNSKGSNLPYYYFENDYMDEKIQEINDNGSTMESGVQFVFFTDAHFNSNSRHSKDIINYIKAHTNVNMCLFGGDVANAYITEEEMDTMAKEWIKYVNDINMPVLIAQGNHDWTGETTQGSGVFFTKPKSFVDYYTVKMVNDINIRRNQGKRYYYCDDVNNKIRYIVLNDCEGINSETTNSYGITPYVTAEQVDWFGNVALNVDDGYSIVVMSHATTNPNLSGYSEKNNIFQQIMTSYKAKNTLTTSHEGTTFDFDFLNCKGDIICHLAGHNHEDSSITTNGLLSITTGPDAHYGDDSDVSRVRYGNVTEQLLDVFSIDTTNRTIKATRIGGGSSREWTY